MAARIPAPVSSVVPNVLDHHMPEGNILDVAGIKCADLDPVAHTEGLEDHQEDTADNVRKCRLGGKTHNGRKDTRTRQQRGTKGVEGRYRPENDDDGNQEYDEVDRILEEIIARGIDLEFHCRLSEKTTNDQADNPTNQKGYEQYRQSKNYLLPNLIYAGHNPEISKLFTP